MYDISAGLEREGLKVDLVLFENRLTKGLPNAIDFGKWDAWVKGNGLPGDWRGHWQTSIDAIDIVAERFLGDTARAAGACYFGLNDLCFPK